jgi:hypothetical protein
VILFAQHDDPEITDGREVNVCGAVRVDRFQNMCIRSYVGGEATLCGKAASRQQQGKAKVVR